MKKVRLIQLIIFMLASAAGFAEQPSDALQADKPSMEKYRVIADRNIFTRYRAAPGQGKPAQGASSSPPRVLSLYILRGIALNGPGKTAFVEEQVSGRLIRARVGTQVAGGTVTDIQADHIIFGAEKDGRQIRVGMEIAKEQSVGAETAGEQAAGQPDPNTPAVLPQAQKAVQDSAKPAADQAGEDAILKKMLERRKREQGQ